MTQAKPHIQDPIGRLRRGCVVLTCCALAFPTLLQAQTTSDACSYAGTNQYAVSVGCSWQTFNKPGSYVANAPVPTGCSASSNDDAFGWFTALSTSTTVTFDPSGSDDAILHVLTGACGGPYTVVACANAGGAGVNETVSFASVVGDPYLIRVQRAGANNGMNGSICIQGLTNDDPCSAIAITPSTSCIPSTYTTTGATATGGIPDPGCGMTPNRDVWFTIVAPASGAITIEAAAGSTGNVDMALYSATACGGTFTLIECDASDGPGSMPYLSFTDLDLVPGDTYYLRVWTNASSGTFNLCIKEPALTGDCYYVLRLQDSYGDGWDGSTVGITLGAGPVQNFTLTNGQQGVFYIPFNEFDLLTIDYTANSPWENEISYLLQLEDGIIFSDGPNPTTGLVHAQGTSCTSPAPDRADCFGGETVCGSSTINYQPVHTGVKADLTVNNRGCLSTDEIQGVWYHFSPSASGTIEFTIQPDTVTDDYDFAVWGPMSSLTCSPGGPPVRCNYSGTSGNTGLSTSATNDSEGGGGPPFSNELTVTAGEIYSLYVSNYSRSGLAFDLTWTLSGGASLDCTVLPVELVGPLAEVDGGQVHLTWSTLSEHESDRFVIERAGAHGELVAIGEVQAQGSSQSRTDYAFTDPTPLSGLNRYRLRQLDLDGGTGHLSNEVTAIVGFGLPMMLSPNPADDQVVLTFEAPGPGTYTWELLDLSGRPLARGTQPLDRGPASLRIPLAAVPTGLYEVVTRAPLGAPLGRGRLLVR